MIRPNSWQINNTCYSKDGNHNNDYCYHGCDNNKTSLISWRFYIHLQSPILEGTLSAAGSGMISSTRPAPDAGPEASPRAVGWH